MPTFPKLSVICCGAVLVVSACRRPIQPAVPNTSTADADAARADSIAQAEAARRAADAEAARLKAEQERLRALQDQEAASASEARDLEIVGATVYFDYDQAMLSDSARAQLDPKVPVLKARPGIRVLITGHTDERGSTEYNLALGLRRASEVKAYLVTQGIAEDRIEIMSMGEEQPAVEGTGERVWALNRRAIFVPSTRGGEEE